VIASLREQFFNDRDIIEDFKFGPNDIVFDPTPLVEVGDMRAKVNGAFSAYSGFISTVILIDDGFRSQVCYSRWQTSVNFYLRDPAVTVGQHLWELFWYGCV
jgi:hypothetical protein